MDATNKLPDDITIKFPPADLGTLIAEDITIKRMGNNMQATYKELKAMQAGLEILKGTLEQTLMSQEERVEIRKLELEHEYELKRIEYDKQRELESHQWERSLPLQSETVGEIVKALNSLKILDLELIKTGRNGRNGKVVGDESSSLEDFLNAYEIPLAKSGVDINHQIIAGYDIKNGDILRTQLVHKSGEFFASYTKLKLDQVPSCTCLAQSRSSALTYAKRHNLQCLLGQ